MSRVMRSNDAGRKTAIIIASIISIVAIFIFVIVPAMTFNSGKILNRG